MAARPVDLDLPDVVDHTLRPRGRGGAERRLEVLGQPGGVLGTGVERERPIEAVHLREPADDLQGGGREGARS